MLAIKKLLWAGIEMQRVLETAQSCVLQEPKFQKWNNFLWLILDTSSILHAYVKLQPSKSTVSTDQQARGSAPFEGLGRGFGTLLYMTGKKTGAWGE